MKFNTNKPYRQRCGREAKITVNDLTGDYPLGGWIIDENRAKISATWTEEGEKSERMFGLINDCGDLVNIPEVLDINGKPVPQEVLEMEMPEGISRDDIEYIIDSKLRKALSNTWATKHPDFGWNVHIPEGVTPTFSSWCYSMRLKHRKDGTPISIDPLPEIEGYNVEYKGLGGLNGSQCCEFICWANSSPKWERFNRVPMGAHKTHYALLTPISKPYTIDTFPLWATRARRKGEIRHFPVGDVYTSNIDVGKLCVNYDKLAESYEIGGPGHDWQPAHEI